jgi:hypothetical protein
MQSIGISFDERRGYHTVGMDVPQLAALSLRMLHQRIEQALQRPVQLALDRAARRERDRRRHGGDKLGDW